MRRFSALPARGIESREKCLCRMTPGQVFLRMMQLCMWLREMLVLAAEWGPSWGGRGASFRRSGGSTSVVDSVGVGMQSMSVPGEELGQGRHAGWGEYSA